MLCSLLLTSLPIPELRLLCMGNSHTAGHDIPGMVAALVQSTGRSVKVETVTGSNLNEIAKNTTMLQKLYDGKWNAVVLQAALVSSSQKYKYSQEGGIALAKAAGKGGATVYLFAEWPRRGVNETAYTESVYREIAKPTGATIIPVGRVWDKVLAKSPKLEVWDADGNHSSPLGAFLAATVIAARFTDGKVPTWRPNGVTKDQFDLFWSLAKP